MTQHLGVPRRLSLTGRTTLGSCTYTWDIHPFTGALSVHSVTNPSGTTHFRARLIAALSPSPVDEGPFLVELLDGSGQSAAFAGVAEGADWALEVLTLRREAHAPEPGWWQVAARRAKSALLHGAQVLRSSWGEDLDVSWALTGRGGVVVTEIQARGHAPESVRILAGHLDGGETTVLAHTRTGETLPATFPNDREAGAYLAGRTAYEHVQSSRAAA